MKIEKLSEEQFNTLALYEGLLLKRIGKTKKEKYELISKELKIKVETIKTWITRYYKSYMSYREEIVEKDSKRLNLEGLTELEARYVRARLSGFGKEEAKSYAGYSETTKAADIEKQSKISKTLEEIRSEFINDEKFGVEVTVKAIDDIQRRAKKYDREVVDKTVIPMSDGKTVSRTITNTNAFMAELGAIKLKASILGYDARTSTVRQEKVGSTGKQRVKIEPRRK